MKVLVRVLPGVVDVMVVERLIVSSQIWRRVARSSISVFVGDCGIWESG